MLLILLEGLQLRRRSQRACLVSIRCGKQHTLVSILSRCWRASSTISAVLTKPDKNPTLLSTNLQPYCRGFREPSSSLQNALNHLVLTQSMQPGLDRGGKGCMSSQQNIGTRCASEQQRANSQQLLSRLCRTHASWLYLTWLLCPVQQAESWEASCIVEACRKLMSYAGRR